MIRPYGRDPGPRPAAWAAGPGRAHHRVIIGHRRDDAGAGPPLPGSAAVIGVGTGLYGRRD
eukprot:240465-Hanusia_phi.AAC.1